MDINYDKSALQQYMNNINGVANDVKRKKSEAANLFNACKQEYTRIHTEIEQIIRSAYNKLEAAESRKRAAVVLRQYNGQFF